MTTPGKPMTKKSPVSVILSASSWVVSLKSQRPSRTAKEPTKPSATASGKCFFFISSLVMTQVLLQLTPKHSGDLGVATKEPRKGRPAAVGRELLRLVKVHG